MSYTEKNYKDFNLRSDKQFEEEVLIQRAVKTTMQVLFDIGLFDQHKIAHEEIFYRINENHRDSSCKS